MKKIVTVVLLLAVLGSTAYAAEVSITWHPEFGKYESISFADNYGTCVGGRMGEPDEYFRADGTSLPAEKDGYELFYPIVNDRLLVRRDGKYGYMDAKYQLVIPCSYDWAEPFNTKATPESEPISYAMVLISKEYALIDLNGNQYFKGNYRLRRVKTVYPLFARGARANHWYKRSFTLIFTL